MDQVPTEYIMVYPPAPRVTNPHLVERVSQRTIVTSPAISNNTLIFTPIHNTAEVDTLTNGVLVQCSELVDGNIHFLTEVTTLPILQSTTSFSDFLSNTSDTSAVLVPSEPIIPNLYLNESSYENPDPIVTNAYQNDDNLVNPCADFDLEVMLGSPRIEDQFNFKAQPMLGVPNICTESMENYVYNRNSNNFLQQISPSSGLNVPSHAIGTDSNNNVNNSNISTAQTDAINSNNNSSNHHVSNSVSELTSPSGLSERSSLFDDVEKSLTPGVERNLDLHLENVCTTDEIRLPDIPLSESDPAMKELHISTTAATFQLDRKLINLQTVPLPVSSTNHNHVDQKCYFQSSVKEVMSNDTSFNRECRTLFKTKETAPYVTSAELRNILPACTNVALLEEANASLVRIPQNNESEVHMCIENVEKCSSIDNIMENVSQNSMASENSSSMFTDSCELSEAESTTREIPDLPQSLEFLDSDVKSLPNYLLKVRNPIKKKNQNRKAAMKYRCKKKSEVTAIGDKLNELKTRENAMRERIAIKEKEVEILEDLLRRKRKTSPNL